MAQVERQTENKRANKRERAKESRGRRAQMAGSVDWGAFDWPGMIALVEEFTKVGGAVRIGLTRDGGAWALGIYEGDDYATEYVRPNEIFDNALNEIVTAWLGDQAATTWWERTLQLRGMDASR